MQSLKNKNQNDDQNKKKLLTLSHVVNFEMAYKDQLNFKSFFI